MYNTPEQVTELNKSVINAALQLTKIALDTTEHLVGLQLTVAKETFADASQTLRPLTEARDLQTLQDLRSKLTENGVEKATAYSRSFYEVATHAQAQISALFEGYMAEWNQTVARNIDQAVKSAPAGADVAIAALQSTATAATAAFEGVTKTAKQATGIADASVKATVKAASTAKKSKPSARG